MRRVCLALALALSAALCAGTATAATGLVGTGASDTLTGSARSDVLLGRGGADDLWGGKGADTLHGEAGGDQLNGGGASDVLLGGPGDDQIHADDGVRDVVSCSTGRDTVFADPVDRVSGCEVNGKKALGGGVLATFEVSDERFRAWVTNDQTMWDLQQLRRGESTANIPNGRVLRGPGGAAHNAPYSWHLDPEDVSMADMTIEVCDAEPSYVEANVDEFVGNVGRYCAWGARLVELRNYTGGPILRPAPVEQPPVVILPDEGL